MAGGIDPEHEKLAVIITRTPHRVSILGGGSDFPVCFQKHGGLVWGLALTHFGYVTVRRLPPYHTFRSRVSYSRLETVADNQHIEHPLVRQALSLCGLAQEGLEVVWCSDVPGQSGLGSSSTFAVGLLNALHCLKGQQLFAEELAHLAIHLERELLGEAGGWQDQFWAACGGMQVMEFRPDGQCLVRPILVADGFLEHLQLFWTGKSRLSSQVTASCPALPVIAQQQAYFAERGLHMAQMGRFDEVGRLVDASWRLKRGLGPGVSDATLDGFYATARTLGAYGGKLTGAGGGGCLLLVSPPARQPAIRQALTALGCVEIPVRVCATGSELIYRG